MHFIIIFVPSITFGLIPSEIFPWVILLTLLSVNFVNYKRSAIICVALFGLTIIPSLINSSFGFLYFKSVISYINAIMAFFIIKNASLKFDKIVYVLIITLFIEISVGVLQALEIGIWLWDLLLPRYLYGFGEARGSSGLTPEPAMQAINIILILSVLINIRSFTSRKNSNLILILLLITPLYMFFVNKSATGVILVIGIGILTVLFAYKNKASVFMILIFLFFMFYLLKSIMISDNRSVDLFVDITNGVNLIDIISISGGFRLQTVLAAYWNPSILGWGLGNWTLGLINNINESYFLNSFVNYFSLNYIEAGVRPMSFFSSVVVEGGFALMLLIIFLLRNGFIELINYKIAFFMIICSILFIGHTGSPIPFALMGVLYLYRTKRMALQG